MLSTSLKNSNSLPSFVTFDANSLTYTIKPLSLDQVGFYTIQLNLTDSVGGTKSYLFDINVGFTNGNGTIDY